MKLPLQVLAWHIDEQANHWAVVEAGSEGPWSWLTQLGRVVSLLSTNLIRTSEPPGARIVDVRWSVDSRYAEDAALAAAAKLGLRPIGADGPRRQVGSIAERIAEEDVAAYHPPPDYLHKIKP